MGICWVLDIETERYAISCLCIQLWIFVLLPQNGNNTLSVAKTNSVKSWSVCTSKATRKDGRDSILSNRFKKIHASLNKTKDDGTTDSYTAQNRTNTLYRQNVIRIIAFGKENKKIYSRVILIIFVFQIVRSLWCWRWCCKYTVSSINEKHAHTFCSMASELLCLYMFQHCLSTRLWQYISVWLSTFVLPWMHNFFSAAFQRHFAP